MTFYRQCRLKRPLLWKGQQKTTTWQITTSWLPEFFAHVGKVVRLKCEAGWSNGWVVEAVSETRLSEDELPDAHRDIKSHRKNTGDAMAKEN